MTSKQAIEAWARYRDGNRVTGWKPDEYTIPIGDTDCHINPDLAGWGMVEKALGNLSKLDLQREVLKRLLIHVYVNGEQPSRFVGVNIGVDQAWLVDKALTALHAEITAIIKATPPIEPLKVVEFA